MGPLLLIGARLTYLDRLGRVLMRHPNTRSGSPLAPVWMMIETSVTLEGSGICSSISHQAGAEGAGLPARQNPSQTIYIE